MAKFDYFRQVSTDYARSTVFGGLISLVCLTVRSLLVLT